MAAKKKTAKKAAKAAPKATKTAKKAKKKITAPRAGNFEPQRRRSNAAALSLKMVSATHSARLHRHAAPTG